MGARYTAAELDRIIDWARCRTGSYVTTRQAIRMWEDRERRRDQERAARARLRVITGNVENVAPRRDNAA